MTMKKHARLLLAVLLASLFGGLVFESQSHAQYDGHRAPVQQLGRLLGLGFGNGYHCRTPGPNTSYYNPYSQLNSQLVGHAQQGGARHGFSSGYYPQNNAFDQRHVPNAVNAPPLNDGFSVFESLPGQTLTPTFERAPDPKSRSVQEAEENDFDVDNDRSSFEPADLINEDDSPFTPEEDFQALSDSFSATQ